MYTEEFYDLVRVVIHSNWYQKEQLKPWFVAQCMLESGRGSSELFKKYLNPFGMHYHPFMKDFAKSVEYKANDGVANYAEFASTTIIPYAYFMWFKTWGHYKGWEEKAALGGFEFFSFIGPFYCPGAFKEPWMSQHNGKNYAEYIRDHLLKEAETLIAKVTEELKLPTSFEMNRTDAGIPFVTAYKDDIPLANHKCSTISDLEDWCAAFPNAVGITVADTRLPIPAIERAEDKPPAPPTTQPLPERIPFAKWFDCGMISQDKYHFGFPKGLIVHFTAGRGNPEDVQSYCAKKGYTLCTIGKDGTLVQSAPLSEWGYHCGTWNQEECIGVEIINAGRLEKRDGKFFSWFGTEIPGDNVRYIINTPEQIEGYYEMYTPEQEKTLIRLCEWLKETGKGIFSYDNVLGHDEACARDGARGRKNDPGGSLSLLMPDFRNLLKKRAQK